MEHKNIEFNKRLIVLLGMHRSGTSAITRGLQVLGVGLGEKLYPPMEGVNDKGFFEDIDINSLNNEMLKTLASDWHYVSPIEANEIEVLRDKGYFLRAVELLRAKVHDTAVFGFKDPRVAKLLPFWKQVFSHCQFEAGYVLAVRHPLSVAKSLAKRDGFDSEKSYLLWLGHVLESIANTNGCKRVLVDYDRLMLDPERELERISEYFALEMDQSKLQEYKQEFLDHGLRHHVYDLNDLLLDNACPSLVREVYFDLLDAAAGQKQLDDYAFQKKTDAWIKEFDRLKPALRLADRIIEQRTSFNQALIEQDRHMAALTQAMAVRDQDISSLKQETEVRKQHISTLNQELAEQKDQISNLNNGLEKKEEMLDELKVKIREKTDSNQELQARILELEGYIFHLKSGLGFRAVSKYRSLIDKVLVQNTRRRRVYDLGIKSLNILLTEGWKGLWSRIKARRKISVSKRHAVKKLAESKEKAATFSTYAPGLLKNMFNVREAYESMLAVSRNAQDQEYAGISDENYPKKESPVKLIAFYLPQFHPIPENNQWWGRGFTEWTNVSKAVPQFAGHNQPHLPGELGFYDLRLPEVQRRQVELAKKYGIYGFCFHYYWFNAKRLLERPLDQFIADTEIDFPFCLCWANENWTRRWDGQENEILMAQEHSEESDLAFIKDLAPVLRHKRYIRIDGRPALIVYRAQLLPDPEATAKRWRDYCHEAGIGGIYLIAAQTFGFADPRSIGFDAAVEFPPHNAAVSEITKQVVLFNPEYTGKVFSYPEFAEKMAGSNLDVPYRLFKTVSPGWDNEPRRPGRGHTYAFSTPSAYKNWLIKSAQYAIRNPNEEERLVFINAWNEWGEGAHLEPDRKFGYAYLQATADALRLLNITNKTRLRAENDLARGDIVKRNNTAVVVHIYYPDVWEEMEGYLQKLQGKFDLFVSIPTDVNWDAERILKKYPEAYVYRCQNRGRDMAPFLKILSILIELEYEFGLKLHTKKTVHRSDGLQWSKDILRKLLSSEKHISAAKRALLEENIGMVAPSTHLLPSLFYWGLSDKAEANQRNVRALSEVVGLSNNHDNFSFVAGSMFWFRPSALKVLAAINLDLYDFEPEIQQKDGTLAHAMERFIGLVIEESGYKIAEIDHNGAVRYPSLSEVKKRVDYQFAAPTRDGQPLRRKR